MDASQHRAHKLLTSKMHSEWLEQIAAYNAANSSSTEAGGRGMEDYKCILAHDKLTQNF